MTGPLPSGANATPFFAPSSSLDVGLRGEERSIVAGEEVSEAASEASCSASCAERKASCALGLDAFQQSRRRSYDVSR